MLGVHGSGSAFTVWLLGLGFTVEDLRGQGSSEKASCLGLRVRDLGLKA